jgi:hypothetical protein
MHMSLPFSVSLFVKDVSYVFEERAVVSVMFLSGIKLTGMTILVSILC